MSGCVGVTILKNNGERMNMNRWTNILPYFFRQVSLYKGEEDKWLSEFLVEWEKMRKDYETNKNTGQYELNMTDVYFPHDTFSPVEYGLVVVDFPNKKIYSSQGYTTLGKMYAHSIRKRYYNNDNDDYIKEENAKNTAEFKELYDNGLITQMSYYDEKEKKYIEQDISDLTWEEVYNFLNEINDTKLKKYSHPNLQHINKQENAAFCVNFFIESDWEMITYNDNMILFMKEDLEKAGIVFTQEDNEAWKEYINRLWWGIDHEEELKENPLYVEYNELYEKMFNKKWLPQE